MLCCIQSGRSPSECAVRMRPPTTPGLLMNITASGFASRTFCAYGAKSVVDPGRIADTMLSLIVRATFLTSFACVYAPGTSW